MTKGAKHFKVITRHRHQVIRNCIKAGIPFQGLRHDLSKYSLTEFSIGARYYIGSRSPNEQERDHKGYSEAWMHHKGRNKHHFEYWNDYSPATNRVEAVKMPLRYVIEMFCDRVAASKVYKNGGYTDSSPLEYYRNAKTVRLIHPETAALVERLLVMLSEKGEDETFAYIKNVLRKQDDY